MIKIRNIQRIAIAAKDLDVAVAKFKKLFGIVPFNYGVAKAEKYHWVAFEMGEGQCTMEFLCPFNDPNCEGVITKRIRDKGEGLYMVTLRTASDDSAEVVKQIRETGLEPVWGSVGWEDPGAVRAEARRKHCHR